ncbi:hypothetical protein GCM10009736_57710 [Actinomadura bangladeshensis]
MVQGRRAVAAGGPREPVDLDPIGVPAEAGGPLGLDCDIPGGALWAALESGALARVSAAG